jgi:hypothetical protein
LTVFKKFVLSVSWQRVKLKPVVNVWRAQAAVLCEERKNGQIRFGDSIQNIPSQSNLMRFAKP